MIATIKGYSNADHAIEIELQAENKAEDALLGTMACNDARAKERLIGAAGLAKLPVSFEVS